MKHVCSGEFFLTTATLAVIIMFHFFCLSGKKKNPGLKLAKEVFAQPAPAAAAPPRDLDSKACVTIGDQNFVVKADDLEQIAELGRGAYGVVDKMRHVPSGVIMAVKRIRATVNTLEQKRLLMDLDISMRTVDCFFTVTFYGALFREVNKQRHA
uniref:mitogen-activated protein kinase kinase n=1 Tax=Labrus bergylta TaxID=56723 RepID=A0A3Q3GDI1_9LABR